MKLKAHFDEGQAPSEKAQSPVTRYRFTAEILVSFLSNKLFPLYSGSQDSDVYMSKTVNDARKL